MHTDTLAVDFETTEVPFFDKKKRKSLDWSGHPRLAQATVVSFKNSDLAVALESFSADSLPYFKTIVFHNAAFDIQVGINAGVWHEAQF